MIFYFLKTRRTRLNNASSEQTLPKFRFCFAHACNHPSSSKFAEHYLGLFFVLLNNVHKYLRKYKESTLCLHAFTDTPGTAALSAILASLSAAALIAGVNAQILMIDAIKMVTTIDDLIKDAW